MVWSNAKIFWGDEMLEYYSDAKPAAAIVVDQLHNPISLEPPAFHLLLHGMHLLVPGHPETASRLLSIIALLVTELCAFWLSWSLTGSGAAALLSATLPFFLVTVDYGPEARVYSCLVACFSVALLCYSRATRLAGTGRVRCLVALSAALGVAMLLHYYAVFLLLPFLGAEAYRTRIRRSFDWPMWLALAVAMCCFALDLPFIKTLHEFSQHYYDNGETQWMMIFFSYLWMVGHFGVYELPRYFHHPVRTLYALNVFAAMVVILTANYVRHQLRAMQKEDRAYSVLALLLGSLLPFCTVSVAHLVTHAYSPRYSLASCAAIAVLLPFLLQRNQRLTAGLTLIFFSAGCVYIVRHVRRAKDHSTVVLADTALTPRLQQFIAAEPDHHLYLQNTARFLVSYFYASPAMKQTMTLVFDQDKELQWRHRDPSSLFARNLGRTTTLPVQTFKSLLSEPGPHLFAIYHDADEEWLDPELSGPAYQVRLVGHEFGSDLYDVQPRSSK